MKYECRIEIELPRSEVVALFDGSHNLHAWQPGLLSYEQVTGEPGMPGATSRLRYRVGRRVLEMVETIIRRDPPAEFSVTYEVGNVWNRVENFFEEAGPGRTPWIARNEFRCRGWMRVMAFLAPGRFSKETEKYMLGFRDFAEGRAE